MALSYEQYQQKKAMLASGGDFSEEAVQKTQAALDDYENRFLAKGAAADEKPLGPGESMRVIPTGNQPAVPTTDEALAQNLIRQLDPSHPLQPQALAIQPATTHPEGDPAAKDEWIRGDLSNPAGKVVVYEAPTRIVQQRLMENPQLFKALGYDAPLSPDAIMNIQPDVVQAYNDYNWRLAADAAAKAGKTAYRYSKAPWLSDGKNASLLDNLSTKIAPGGIGDGLHAYVMGVDTTGTFGVGTALSNAGLFDSAEDKARYAGNPPAPAPDAPQPVAGGEVQGKDEIVNSPHQLARSTRELNDMLKEGNPALYTAGEVTGAVPALAAGAVKGLARGAASVAGLGGEALGAAAEGAAGAVSTGVDALKGWLPSNALWNYVLGNKPAQSAVGALVGGIGRPALASGISQGINEGATAAANYAASGDTGTDALDAAGRVAGATVGGAMLGAPFAAAHGLGEWTRWGKRYDELPGRMENLGAKVKPILGHVGPPALQEAKMAARATDVLPGDVLAEKLDQPIKGAAKAQEANVRSTVAERNAPVYASPEGQAPLPATELVTETVRELRKRTASKGADTTPSAVGTPGAEREARGIFNTNIEGVSVHPTDGAVRLTPEEAQAWLHPESKGALLESIDSKKPVALGGERLSKIDRDYADGYAFDPSELEHPNAGKDEAQKGGFLKQLEDAGVDSVYVLPRQHDALRQESVIARLRPSTADTANNRDLGALYHAALRDRDLRSVNGEPGGWSAMQQQNSQQLGAAKDIRKRAAPKEGGAYSAVVGIGNRQPGQSRTWAALQQTAQQAGGENPELLRAARMAAPLDRLQQMGGLGSAAHKGLFGLSALGDMLHLRGVYPVTRMLEQVPHGGEGGRIIPAIADYVARGDRQDAANESQRAAYEKAIAAAPPPPKATTRRRNLYRARPKAEEQSK